MAQNMVSGSDELSGRVLLFNIGSALYGLPLTHVLEIINIQKSTHLPNTPIYIKGVVNLRGKVVPVIDVRLKFNMEERPYDDKTCIIVTEIHEMQIGLIVDSVSEVVTLEASHMSTPPERSVGDQGESNRYLASVSELDGKIVLNIDCEKFFQSDLDQ